MGGGEPTQVDPLERAGLYFYMFIVLGNKKGKGNVSPRTGHEGPEGEYRYSSTLSLTSALARGG
jgi:hypothetical protein